VGASGLESKFGSSVSRLGEKGRDHFGSQDGFIPRGYTWHLSSAWDIGVREATKIPAPFDQAEGRQPTIWLSSGQVLPLCHL